MALLAQTRRPVPLRWLTAELRAGRRPPGAVAVTFDDAYRDVLENAQPSLVRHGVPATVFVVSGTIGSERGYWWDELAQLVLGDQALPEAMDLPVPSPEVELARQQGDRSALHMALWRLVRLRPEEERATIMRAVARAYGDPPIPYAPVMTEHELRSITDGGLVSLGVHTVTHPSLPSLTVERQREELAASRAEVERIAGEPLASLAYPFGDYDETTIGVARSLGFDHAVSVEAGWANDWGRRFALPRIDVKDWPDARFLRTLAWLG
ncbi:polysaccharide deacetylase family protein [Rubellimicrobium mesophilum]|uniref:polysaccharide deacetylase family protein n=1 Tax=Rubellimicrobium mesophilum TaxID=1123067 RepID=UPI00248145FB|nr:polysaccharide deacetylase family protein [Rubellimicrobium mesophilum]